MFDVDANGETPVLTWTGCIMTPYANGIEVSRDDREFYVASSGLFPVTAFSNTNPTRVLRSTGPLAFVPV